MLPITPPFILTLALDAPSQARLQALRDAHFPPALNRVPAHVTLFHHLPGGEEAALADLLGALCAAEPPRPVRTVAPYSLGRGVALRLEAPEVAALHARVADAFADRLTPQDRQPWRPHATIQNKADPAEARALLDHLSEAFEPWDMTAEGLLLWRYRGGPWEAAGRYAFAGTP